MIAYIEQEESATLQDIANGLMALEELKQLQAYDRLAELEVEIPKHTLLGSNIRSAYIQEYAELMVFLGYDSEEIQAKKEELYNSYDEEYYNECIENGIEPN